MKILILDCETATLPFVREWELSPKDKQKIGLAKPLVYDVGWTVFDTSTGVTIKKASYLVQETFFVPNIFNTAYYRDKRELYFDKLAAGEIKDASRPVPGNGRQRPPDSRRVAGVHIVKPGHGFDLAVLKNPVNGLFLAQGAVVDVAEIHHMFRFKNTAAQDVFHRFLVVQFYQGTHGGSPLFPQFGACPCLKEGKTL